MIKNYDEIIHKKWKKQKGLCEVCSNPLFNGSPQLAHRISKSKWAVKKYGIEVIDHPDNLALVCSLRCNAAVLIDKKDVPCEELAKKIKDKLCQDITHDQ